MADSNRCSPGSTRSNNGAGSQCSSVSFVVGICCLLLVVTGCTIGGATKHPTWKNATGAEQYERLMWQAIRDKDWTNVEHHLAPTFVGVNSSGQSLDRTAWLGYWKGAPIKDFSIAEIAVQPAGTHMVVTYVLHAGGQGAQAASASGLRVVSVWQQVKRGWTLTTTTMTPIAPLQNPSSSDRHPATGLLSSLPGSVQTVTIQRVIEVSSVPGVGPDAQLFGYAQARQQPRCAVVA